MGIIVKANIETPIIKTGKYQIKLDDPKTIGDEINNPRNAFLESVRLINQMKLILIKRTINLLNLDFF